MAAPFPCPWCDALADNTDEGVVMAHMETAHPEPALTQEEWRDALDPDVLEGLAYEKGYLWGRERPHGAIAILNATLPDSDRRKITREKVARIRHLAELAWLREMSFKIAEPFAKQNADRAKAEILAFADALESYLPPATAERPRVGDVIELRRLADEGRGSGPARPGTKLRIGYAVIPCPKCSADVDTANAAVEEQLSNGLRWVGVPCTKCGTTFTIEMLDDGSKS